MRILFLSILLTTAFTCFSQKREQPMPVNPEFKRFVFEPNQQIVLKPYDSLYFDIAYESGDFWVFWSVTFISVAIPHLFIPGFLRFT
jgi:hypothetical protein